MNTSSEIKPIDMEPVTVDRSRLTHIDIWQPRWHDRIVLIAARKVGEFNWITFSKAPQLPGDYFISYRKIRNFKKESNGKIDCYAVPLDELRKLEVNHKDYRFM